MTLNPHEFIRRFLIHVLPTRFHRIRHYGLFASSKRLENIARARELLAVPKLQTEPVDAADRNDPRPCPHCGGRMIIIETFARGSTPGIGRQVRSSRSGSTPHDNVTNPQIRSLTLLVLRWLP